MSVDPEFDNCYLAHVHNILVKHIFYTLKMAIFHTCISPCRESNCILHTGQINKSIPSRATWPEVSSREFSWISPSWQVTVSL